MIRTYDLLTEQITERELTPQEITSLSIQQLSSALTYAQKRVAEYPPITDYLDGIVKGDTAQVDAYIAACLAVKALHPKA